MNIKIAFTKKQFYFFSILILSLCIVSLVGAQTWSSSGPSYKALKAIGQSPANSNILYAGAFGSGVYKSTDNGLTWVNQRVGITNSYVRSIYVLNDNTVFIGTNDGLYKTVNGGSSWVLSLATLNSVRSIDYDVSTNSLYSATYGTGLFKSMDQGVSWTPLTVFDAVTNQTLLHQWVVKVYASNSLYVGGLITEIDSGSSLFRSVNGGSSWSQVQRGVGIRSSVHSISLDPSNLTTGLIIGTAANGMYRSSNSGVNWSSLNGSSTTHPLADPQINSVGFTTAQFFAGTDSLGNVYSRLVSDATFGWSGGTGLPGSQAPISNIKIDGTNNTVVYATTEGQGLYKSTNSGTAWLPLNSGMMGTAGRIVRRNGNGNIILGTDFGDGVWISSNAGSSWTKQDSLSTSNGLTSIGITNNPLIVYLGAYGTGVFKSTDGGHIWQITDSTIINHFVRTLSVQPTDLNIVYTGTGNGVFKTTNGGTTWFAANSGMPFSTSIRSMALDKINPNVIYAGTDSNYIFKSTNGGSSWSHFTNADGFLTQDIFIRTITIDNASSNVVFAGSDSGRIYKSTNAGVTWSLLYKLPTVFSVRSILEHPADPNIYFAGTFGAGIFLSEDAGVTWNTFNSSLSDLEIYSLDCDNSTPLNLFAGSGSNGVFHTTYLFTNRAPVLASIGGKSVIAGQLLSFNVSAMDSDATIPVLSVRDLPSGASFTDSLNGHGNFSWTPSFAQIGNYTMTVIASDINRADSEVVHIVVVDTNLSIAMDLGKDAGWNLLSVPIVMSDYSRSSLFPTATSSAYAYVNGYTATELLSNGSGYWIKFPAATTVHLDGIKMIQDTVSVNKRWNIIGSITFPIPLNRLVPVPPLTISSSFYSYESGVYSSVDTLKPGKGYWIKVSADGKLVFDTSAAVIMPGNQKKANNSLSQAGKNELDNVTIVDADNKLQKLYIPKENQPLAAEQFELPPLPPQGSFNVRFGNEQSAAIYGMMINGREEFPVNITGGKYPLSMSWHVSQHNPGWYIEVRRVTGSTERFHLEGNSSVMLEKAVVVSAAIVHNSLSENLPEQFTLHQNYPNPFNPSTEIAYSLAADSRVTIRVFDILGRTVSTLTDEVQTRGEKHAIWDAGQFANGVYYYRMLVTDPSTGKVLFQSVKKMALIK